MKHKKFERLIRRGILTEKKLSEVMEEAGSSNGHPEDILSRKGIPKHEILFCLSEYYGLPFVEYDEGIVISQNIIKRLDMARQKKALWIPLSVYADRAEIIAYDPEDPLVVEDVKRTLGVKAIDFMVAMPADIIRIIENNLDLNPNFPSSAGRTPLAKARTFLADRRSLFACYRTSLAKGRTGLAFLRTGISFITIGLLLFRIFGFGYLAIVEAALLTAGIVAVIDGLLWYLPARKTGRKRLDCRFTEPTSGTTVLEVSNSGDNPVFTRTGDIEGADDLRADWTNLSPVMRRRFLANDRTDLAEERTILACYRTVMAKARTGLSFTRTGIALVGLGIGLLRQFPIGIWTTLDAVLLSTGILMVTEGFYWYAPGRRAGKDGLTKVQEAADTHNIWDFAFPPVHRQPDSKNISYNYCPPLKSSQSPGIWATTGLALERTLLAERRNVMARLRTVMARSRTGMAFIRTGMVISAVGMGLLVYFGTGNVGWAIFDIVMIITGIVLIADGLYWYIPAEKTRRQFPYCYGEMEITIPDYGISACLWKKAVFDNGN